MRGKQFQAMEDKLIESPRKKLQPSRTAVGRLGTYQLEPSST